jgi:sulfide:quinone oxidoreductase
LWWPPGKVAGRYLAPLLATARPRSLAAAALEDDRPPAAAAAQELALLLADEEAAMGDFGQALRALDAAAALGGGALPDAWAKRREVWRAAHRHAVA